MGEEETRPENLWIPQSTDSRTHFDFVSDVWSTPGDFAVFHLIKPKAGVNGLSTNMMQDMYQLHKQILQINVSTDNSEFPGMWDFERKCKKRGENCVRTIVLDIFDTTNETVISSLTDNLVVEFVNEPSNYVDNTGTDFTQPQIMGGLTEDSRQVTDAAAFLTSYVFNRNEVTVDGSLTDPAQEEFEKAMMDTMDDFNSQYFDILYYTDTAWRDEFSKLIQGDISLIAITYFLIVLYAAVNLGKRNSVRSGGGLSLAAVFSVVFAWRASYGFAALLGEKITPLHSTILFLLLALGVDDAFVICGEYHLVMANLQKGVELDVPELMGRVIQHAGQSIMLTSVTDFFVFILGATTVLPALSSYCIYAGLGVLFDFLFQCTFFVACLTINHYRIQQGRYDCLCCKKPEEDSDVELTVERCCCCCPPEEPIYLPTLMEKLAEKLSNTVVASTILVIAAACVALGIFGLVDRDVEFDVIWFIPEESTPYQFTIQQREYFNAPVRVGLYTKDMDYYANQDAMLNLHRVALSSQYLDSEWGIDDWHYDFLLHANAALLDIQLSATGNPRTVTGGADLYYSTLKAWIENEGSNYEQNILWSTDNPDRIQGAKIDAEFKGKYVSAFGNERFDAMVGLRDEISAAAPTAFAFSYNFLYWEEFGIIKRELLRNVIIAMICIIIVVFSLIQDKRAAVATMIAILCAIVDVAGFATFWDLTYNGVTTIYTLIALGLSVDYSIHIGYKFSTVSGDSTERLRQTMKLMGPPVLHGALSTLIAVLALAATKTFIFQTFFKMFVLVGTLGAAHGLIVLPCILFLFGGDNTETHEDKHVSVEIQQTAISTLAV